VGDRAGYWFPLVLLGFGLLAMLGWDSEDFGWFAYAPSSDGGTYLGTEQYVARNSVVLVRFEQGRYPPRDWPWPVLVTTTFVATVAWYGWRARRSADVSTLRYVALALGGGIAVLVGYAAAGIADVAEDPAGFVSSVGLPLLALGGVAGAWALSRHGPGRRVAALVSVGCLVVGLGTVLGTWSPGLYDPVVIAAGLFALARLERSRLLVVVAATALVAMVAFPTGTLSMLLPAAVALAGAIAALAYQGRAAPA
jgi:hypothetical protein